MKILIFDLNLPSVLLNESKPFGGSAVDLYALLKGLEYHNVQIGIMADQTAINKLKYSRISKNYSLIKSFKDTKGLTVFDSLFIKTPLIEKGIKTFNPDIVTVKCPSFLNSMISIICKRNNIKFVYQIANDIEVDRRIAKKLNVIQYILFKIMIGNADIIRCQNIYQLRSIKKLFPKKDVFLLRNAFYNSNAKNFKLNPFERRKYFLWVGTFRPQKNLNEMVRIVKENPSKKFIIIGEKFTKMDDFTKTAYKQLLKMKNVKFTGFIKRDEVLKYLSESYALISTSVHEGFPNIFLESWSQGTPVITSKLVNPDNLVKKYTLGSVTLFRNYTKEINKLCNKKYFTKLSNNCFEYLKKNHNYIDAAELFLTKIGL